MRLTIVQLQKILPTNAKTKPKGSFRRPMQGRYQGRKREPKPWGTWMGEIDEEEVNELGQTVPVRERVPMIMVPDLDKCKLKPYVVYSAAKHHESPLQSKDLFDTFYAPQIQAEFMGTKLEHIPDAKSRQGLLSRVKNVFSKPQKSEENKEREGL